MESTKNQVWKNRKVNTNVGADTEVDKTKLESEDKKKSRTRSLWLINVQICMLVLNYSIVVTGLLPYLRQVRSAH